MSDRSTIFARSSGGGRAGIAVHRISGPLAGEVLDRFCGGRGEARQARLVRVRTAGGDLLDQGLSLWFPGPASFTGEDVAELHLHGSPAVDQAFAREMIAFGLEPATAGAFTMRAFEAGKLDLVQAEALADLLDAETEGQRRQALGQLGGRLSELAGAWRERLVAVMAELTASIDFADEEGVPEDVAAGTRHVLRSLATEMRAALGAAGGAQRVREGVTIAIVGPPNAGKSSLLNALAGEERAIVSRHAGTTRDIVEVITQMGGQRVTLLDTAGLREASDEVELEGIERARSAAVRADLTIEMIDASDAGGSVPHGSIGIANKIDLTEARPAGWLHLSLATREGFDDVMTAIDKALPSAEAGPLTRERHVQLVGAAVGRIEAASNGHAEPEILTEELRLAMTSLAELTGEVAVEEVLGTVFSSFCIGK